MTLHLFGYEAAPPDAQLSPERELLARYLTGQPVAFTPELAKLVLQQFSLQEQFRLTLVAEVKAVVTELQERATAVVERLEEASKRAGEYTAGFRCGTYTEATNAAQRVQDAINRAMGAITE